MRRLAAALTLAVLLLASATARGADPVVAAVQLDRTSINVGDRIALNVIVDADAGYAVSGPRLALGSFEVVQTQDVRKTQRGSQVRYTYRYQITAWTLGDLVLPAIAVAWVGPNGESGTAATQEMAVKVASVVQPGEDTADIKPIKPQLDLAESVLARAGRIALGVAAALLVTGLVALVLWLLLRHKPAPSVEEGLTPVQRALRELDALAALRLPEQGRTAEHYERLTSSLRRYVVESFGVEPGRTSREIRDALERVGLERTRAAAIYEILREGDEVRFRHTTPYPAHAQNAVRSALDIIRRAASAEEYEMAPLRPQ